MGAIGIEAEDHHDEVEQVHFATGRHIDVVAPAASNVLHPVGSAAGRADDGYWRFHDTSAAAPLVAGSAGLLLSYVEELTNEDLTEVIARQCRNLERLGELSSGYDDTTGFGLVRLDDSLCWLTENDVGHGAVSSGWTSIDSTSGVRAFRDLPNDSTTAGTWRDRFAWVYHLKKYVPFTDYSGNDPVPEENVWARGRQCSGWRDTLDVDVLEDLNWAGLVPESASADGCTLETFFYKVYEDDTETVVQQWFPFDPFAPLGPVLWWRYTYLYPCESGARGPEPDAAEHTGLSFFSARSISLTSLRVNVTRPVTLHLNVFDVVGRLVSRREFRDLEVGVHRIVWNRRDRRGRRVAPGIYFAQLATQTQITRHRFVVPR